MYKKMLNKLLFYLNAIVKVTLKTALIAAINFEFGRKANVVKTSRWYFLHFFGD